jgi:hypothetical protein
MTLGWTFRQTWNYLQQNEPVWFPPDIQLDKNGRLPIPIETVRQRRDRMLTVAELVQEHIREALRDYVPKIVHATHHCLVPDGALSVCPEPR